MISGSKFTHPAIFSLIVLPVHVIPVVSKIPNESSSFMTANTPPASSKSSINVEPAGAK